MADPNVPPVPNERGIASSRALQEAYWRSNPTELGVLASRFREDSLDWPRMLRLHHLLCLRALESEVASRQLEEERFGGPWQSMAPGAIWGDYADLALALRERLDTPDSPFRARPVAMWIFDPSRPAQRDSDLMGLASNASVTHLGSIEAVLLDEAGSPMRLDFVSLDELNALVVGGPGPFRVARLWRFGQEPTFVWLPMIYGPSWRSSSPHDTDGSLTRFVNLDGLGKIGIGHQDLEVSGPDDMLHMMGVGRIVQMNTLLDMRDERFDEKCRARGLDPVRIRSEVSGRR